MAFRRMGKYSSENQGVDLDEGLKEFPPGWAAVICLLLGAAALATAIIPRFGASEGLRIASFCLIAGTAIASIVYILGFRMAFAALDDVEEDIASDSPEMARVKRMAWRPILAGLSFCIAFAALVVATV